MVCCGIPVVLADNPEGTQIFSVWLLWEVSENSYIARFKRAPLYRCCLPRNNADVRGLFFICKVLFVFTLNHTLITLWVYTQRIHKDFSKNSQRHLKEHCEYTVRGMWVWINIKTSLRILWEVNKGARGPLVEQPGPLYLGKGLAELNNNEFKIFRQNFIPQKSVVISYVDVVD